MSLVYSSIQEIIKTISPKEIISSSPKEFNIIQQKSTKFTKISQRIPFFFENHFWFARLNIVLIYCAFWWIYSKQIIMFQSLSVSLSLTNLFYITKLLALTQNTVNIINMYHEHNKKYQFKKYPIFLWKFTPIQFSNLEFGFHNPTPQNSWIKLSIND